MQGGVTGVGGANVIPKCSVMLKRGDVGTTKITQKVNN